MRDQMEQRREELTKELEQGQQMLAEIETRRAELQQTLLRISGALQVLTELLEPDDDAAAAGQAARTASPVAAVG